jgi:hypothetical protein
MVVVMTCVRDADQQRDSGWQCRVCLSIDSFYCEQITIDIYVHGGLQLSTSKRGERSATLKADV